MTTAEKYVTAAYVVLLAVVLLYVVIYAFKLQRLERELARLGELARRGRRDAENVQPDRELADTRS